MKLRRASRARKPSFLLVSIVITITITTVLSGVVRVDEEPNPHTAGSFDEIFKAWDLEVDAGDLAFEREETRHELIIMDHSGHSVLSLECRGENITSLVTIACKSMDICEEHKACLFNNEKCTSGSKVRHGKNCLSYENTERGDLADSSVHARNNYNGNGDTNVDSSSSSETSSSSSASCFRLELSRFDGHVGILQCTSEEAGVNVTTFDHYAIGLDNGTFLSGLKNVTGDLIKMKLYVSSLVQNLKANHNATLGEERVSLYVDEEVISFECVVPSLIFHEGGVVIRVYRQDGSVVKLGGIFCDSRIPECSEMTSISRLARFLIAELRGFRVPADVVAFSCAAQRTNSSGQWLENRINVTVRDLPSEVTVKASEFKTLTVNLTPGSKVNLDCELTGPLEVKKRIGDRMRKMYRRFGVKLEPKSNSIIEFVRFSQVAGENLICSELDQDYSSTENSSLKMELQGTYGQDGPFNFMFNLAPAAPKIFKPRPSYSTVHLIYQEDHFADQTIFCSCGGEPRPRITWMKNSVELFSAKPMRNFHTEKHEEHVMPGHESTLMERASLQLDAQTIEPDDFKLRENGRASVNLSCIVRNQFGSDRLDFIILMPMSDVFTHNAGNPGPPQAKATENPAKNSTSRTKTTTAFLIVLFFAVVFIFLLSLILFWSHQTARTAVSASDGSGAILSFQNNPDGSMSNVLINDQSNQPE